MKPTPLFVDTYDLTLDICRQLDGDPAHLSTATVDTALALLTAVAEALRQAQTPLEEADEHLARLRLLLRLRTDLDRGDRGFALRMLEKADAIGRQIGALLRRAGRA